MPGLLPGEVPLLHLLHPPPPPPPEGAAEQDLLLEIVNLTKD